VAGNVTHDDVLARVQASFPTTNGQRPERVRRNPAAPKPVSVLSRDTEQAHVVCGVRGVPANDPERYALTVVNQVLGGGMSSRLFQEIRETRGLAYSVFSYQAGFDDTGYLAIYAGTAPERVDETLGVIESELRRLVDDALSDNELDAAKGHLVGSLAMSLETSASRMRRIGRAETIEGDVPSLDEVVARIERVEIDDVRRVIDRVFRDAPRALAVVGPHREADFT
jgi:predicted Zn-dependent peptidase